MSFFPVPWLVFFSCVCVGVVVRAENWPGFRGPRFDGSSAERNLPVSITKDHHVKWKTKLPGFGSSTPAVWNDAVFVTSENAEKTGVRSLKLNVKSGEIEWSHALCEALPHDRRSDLATPSPATDGKMVVFLSGNGDLSARDFAGTELWHRRLQEDFGPFALKWTYSSSPVFFEGLLYLQILQRSEPIDQDKPGRLSFVVALDPATGQEKWKQERRSLAVGESQEAYSTPIPFEHHGRKEILVSGADCLTGHDPKTGTELWRWGSWNRQRVLDWRIVASPVFGNGFVVGCSPKGGPVYAVEAGGNGLMTLNQHRWSSIQAEISCDITSPLFYQGFFYFLNGRMKVLSCVRPGTGDVVWIEQIPARAKIEASPVAADGKIYVISHTAEVFVFTAGEHFELLHSSVLGEDVQAKNRASIVPAMNRLFIRVGEELWCME